MQQKTLVTLALSFLVILLVVLWFVTGGSGTVKTFETTIDSVQAQDQDQDQDQNQDNDRGLLVNCSDQVNRGKHGDRDDIGYLCSIKVTDGTKLADADGTPLTFDDFANGDSVRITFSKGKNISSRHLRQYNAAEITRLQQAQGQAQEQQAQEQQTKEQ
ncbi:hypothetical protein [Paenibacillus sacheonensis]|uniref:Uncharacterized protein n=1 Tax=Paenibacillus sacheonensis TaxID=742054 RepID=A0A7X5C1N5_9BACL|nr:hypothetical protein [Paenibacillus sacheonensis]MBM7568038.1 hypothetical protein [Paenibacillus sacheonensis]NBC72932.1 hypothetical protein [Paenibacillus sacheonensis]